jgi:hypothetical protein
LEAMAVMAPILSRSSEVSQHAIDDDTEGKRRLTQRPKRPRRIPQQA